MESLNKQDFYLLKCDFNTNKKVVIRKPTHYTHHFQIPYYELKIIELKNYLEFKKDI